MLPGDETDEYKPDFLDTTDRSPLQFYEDVREHGDVVWDPHMKAWLAVSDATARQVLMDDVLFAHPYPTMKAGDIYRQIRNNNPRSFQFMVGEEHRNMHHFWLVDLLSPKWVEAYKGKVIEPAVDRLVDGLRNRAAFDIVDDFAEFVPVSVFAHLLDLETDRNFLTRIKKLNDDIAEFQSLAKTLVIEEGAGPREQAIIDKALESAEELNQILLPYIRDRKSGIGEDFISRLWAGGRRLYDDWNELDVLDGSRRLLGAGSESSVHAIANAFYMLLSDKQLTDTVREGPIEVLQSFVEESLRLHGPVQLRIRRATEDTTLGNAKIRKGDMVVPMLVAANHDSLKYRCPHSVDLERSYKRSHLSFIVGPRQCPGASLARTEIAISIERMLRAFPDLRFAPGAPEPKIRGFQTRSYRPIHVIP